MWLDAIIVSRVAVKVNCTEDSGVGKQCGVIMVPEQTTLQLQRQCYLWLEIFQRCLFLIKHTLVMLLGALMDMCLEALECSGRIESPPESKLDS